MAFDFHKHKKGDAVRVHCCDSCARAAGVQPKYPPDSGSKSWLCEVCGHHGIGSAIDCTIGDWLRLQPRVWYGNCHNPDVPMPPIGRDRHSLMLACERFEAGMHPNSLNAMTANA